MSSRESEEKGDQRLTVSPEATAMRTPDAQAARVAGVSDVNAAQDLNPNKHNGSAGGDQLESIQIIALDEGGKKKVVAERQKEAKQQPEKPQDTQDQMDTGTLLALEVNRNPAVVPVQNLHTWAKQLPEGPDKDRYSQLVREQMADLSPEDKARASRQAHINQHIKAARLDEGGIHEAIIPDKLILQGQAKYQENEWEGFNRLDPKQQRAIIEAFAKASNIAQDSYMNQIQAVADSVPKGFYNVGKELYDSGIAAATFMIEAAQRPEKIPEAAQKLADNLSTAIISGARVSQVIAGYSQEVAQSGDYSRPLRDLQTVTKLANERWEAMPLEKRTEKASELVAEMGVGSIIGATHNLAKSGKLIDALEDLAQYAKDLTAPGRDKAKQAIGAFLDDVFQPKGLTTDGFEMPIPKPPRDIDDLVMLKNKGLPDNVKPSEQVSLTERLTTAGYVEPEILVPKEVYKAASLQGFTSEAVDQKLQIVAEALQNAFAKIGKYNPGKHGSERAYGNLLHEQMRQNLLKIDDKAIHPEASYLKQSPASWGKLGTSRVDVSLGDKEKPFVSICLKTLKAVPSAQQERGWARNLPRLEDGNVPPRLYLKLPKPGE